MGSRDGRWLEKQDFLTRKKTLGLVLKHTEKQNAPPIHEVKM